MTLKLKKADYIVVTAILVWGLVGFWFNIQHAGAVEHKYATIYVENEQVAELSLSENDSYEYRFDFGPDNQHTAVVEVEAGRIRMMPLEGDVCPRQICSHTSWIEHSYEKIVCLPNQIMITFNESSRGNIREDLDGVTY
ncbi:MAG: NusG domain II-containing protein [Bacillota bacterium]